uniref:Uncharacterized protein n=1 Tax=Arion vulgaris TaxID=1028688 RepID=A0A0B6ZVS2_9EUPU
MFDIYVTDIQIYYHDVIIGECDDEGVRAECLAGDAEMLGSCKDHSMHPAGLCDKQWLLGIHQHVLNQRQS